MYCKNFSELSKGDAAIAGGKGASLGEMTNAEIPVPPGFVVLADAFEKFLAETDLNIEIDSILHSVDMKAMHTVEHASETIQKLILEARMPGVISEEIMKDYKDLCAEPARNTSVSDVGGFVAVRSSATAEDSASAAWAGQLDSFLNTTEETLLKNVQRCWASLFTPRAVFYRFEKGLHAQKISVAVVVQKMIQSEVSGIAFSVHPVTEDRNQLIIEAGFGLGEAIVSGQITPDSYVVEKEPRRIIDKNIAEQERGIYRSQGPTLGSLLRSDLDDERANEWQSIPTEKRNLQKLSNDQILELSEIIIGIENHYGFPCDIEWAFEGGEFYIVQSRPITTLSIKNVATDDASEIVQKLKSTDCQIDWAGPFSLLHYSIAANGYFKAFHDSFGKNLSFVYLSYHHGVATAYLPIDEYQELGVYLAEKSRNEDFRSEWIRKFKETADAIRKTSASLSVENFFDHLSELRDLYDLYTAYQVASKTASNFLAQENDQSIFKEFEEARKYSETLFLDIDIMIMNVLDGIKGQYTKEQLMFALSDEAFDIVNGNVEISSELLQNRYDRCGVFANGEGYHILDAQSADEIESEWSKIESDGTLKGNSAFPGIVTGICRIIKNYKSAEISEGEILVTGMTDPNFVPLMKKAAAIVTDGGGLLYHAAIVARELKKSCVIGTKFGTKILKDGDLVEVDADNGVVRILARVDENDIPKLHDYQKLFQWKGAFSYFLNSFFMGIYGSLYTLSFFDGEMWRSFLPLKTKERTLSDGVTIYGSAEKYTDLQAGIFDGYQSLKKVFDAVLNKEDLSREDIKKCFDISLEYYSFYAKTEFFYTDKAFGEQEKNKQIQKNLVSFEALKLKGREQLNELALIPGNYLEKLLQKIGSQFQYDEEDLRNLSMEEVLMIFDGAFPVAKSNLLSRKKSYVTIGVGAPLRVLIGEESMNFSKEFLKDLKHDQELRGQSAQRGVVRGVARVFRISLSEIGETGKLIDAMAEGEILIADTTAPEIIAACKKASAIVTNQGGLLSHAAIISRELGIPCVVGTGYATEIIQTGDMIEVDADSGIVRIITGNF